MNIESIRNTLSGMFQEVAHVENFEVRYDPPGMDSVTLTIKILDFTGSFSDDEAYYAFAYVNGLSEHVAAVHSMPSPEDAVKALFRNDLEDNLRFALANKNK